MAEDYSHCNRFTSKEEYILLVTCQIQKEKSSVVWKREKEKKYISVV